jgi:paraquat-inducible protein A
MPAEPVTVATRAQRGSPPSLQRTVALAVAAMILLVPANVLPVMRLSQAGGPAMEPTILAGVRLLMQDRLWGLAAIVFAASIVVPALKILGMALLVAGVRWRALRYARPLTRLHAWLERIGRWSMLDVFLVGFLAGNVQFGRLAQVEPRSGIVAFAAVVILTMLATRSFDPRWLWLPERPVDG